MKMLCIIILMSCVFFAIAAADETTGKEKMDFQFDQENRMNVSRVDYTEFPLEMNSIPDFREPFIIQANGKNLKVAMMADPFMVDWDGDGLNDLIIGQFMYGKILFYPNSGSNIEPVFTTGTYLQADGSDITSSYG
jgi:hypothetical protein